MTEELKDLQKRYILLRMKKKSPDVVKQMKEIKQLMLQKKITEKK